MVGRPREVASLLAWTDRTLAGRGQRRVHEPDQVRVRTWSTTFRVETTAGTLWAKAVADGYRYEVPLTALLADVAPHDVVRPMVVDSVACMMLLADGGPSWRIEDGPPPSVSEWSDLMRRYSRLQRATETRIDELIAAGVPDFRTTSLTTRFATLLETSSELIAAGLSHEEFERLTALAPVVASWAREIERVPIPPTIEHDDLSVRAVFRRSGAIFDWGDAVIAHPFGSLQVALDPREGGWPVAEPAAIRVAYLQAWSDIAPLDVLEQQATVAELAARISRLSNLLRLSPAVRQEHAEWRIEWIRELLAAAKS